MILYFVIKIFQKFNACVKKVLFEAFFWFSVCLTNLISFNKKMRNFDGKVKNQVLIKTQIYHETLPIHIEVGKDISKKPKSDFLNRGNIY